MNAEGYTKWTRKQLLDVEERPSGWHGSDRQYSQVLVIGNRTKHDSGYMCMTVLGVWRDADGLYIERCARGADDVEWKVSIPRGQPRTDCLWPSGALQFWVDDEYGIVVGTALSSLTIEVVVKPLV